MSETFGEWELLTRLGSNELGETHLALRRADQRKAVLKRFSPTIQSDVSFYGPLKLELSFAAQLEHPSAAAILEQGEINGVAFVAFEFVDGITLAKLSQASQATGGWPLSMDRAATLMRPVLDALSAAHARTPPLLHRDLVPQNLLVTCEGRVVVTDFGLGRARLRAGGNTGMRRAYVSPEQARGNAIDARSEVFTAGLILFELVCGRLPAQGGAGEVISRIATGELDAPLSVNPMLDDAAVAVLKRALCARPEERFASAREFFDAIAPWATGTAEEPLAAWVTRLDGVKATPPEAPAPAPHVVALVTTAKVPALTRSTPWRRNAALAAAVMGGLYATYQLIEARPSDAVAVDPATTGRPLELTSIPSGAQVFVDGVLEDRRTPLTLYIPKDELRNIMLKKQGLGIWSGHVANTRKLEVTMSNGALVEDRYEGARPAPKEEVEPKVAGDVPSTQQAVQALLKREVVFDAESPPIEVVLTAAHSVNGEVGPTLDIGPNAVGSASEGAALYISPASPAFNRNAMMRGSGMKNGWGGGSTGSFKVLNIFALKNTAGELEVLDLSKPVTFTSGGQYHFFCPTESGEITTTNAYAKVNDESIRLTAENVLRVDQDDSFLIRVLSPKVSYRVELRRADGTKGPLPVVLMSMRPEADLANVPMGLFQNSLRFDGQPVPSGQLIVGAGPHTVLGARNVWFTIITAKGVVPPDVTLTVRPSLKKLR